MRDLPVIKLDLGAPESYGNLARKLSDDERRTLATDLIELVNADSASMEEWSAQAQGYLDKVDAARGDSQPQNREQEGAGEKPPPSTELTLSSVIQFSARATDALLGEPDLAKASEPGGEALASWLSSQLRTADPNWLMETDPLVVHMAVTGLAWRKRSFDDYDKAFHSHFIPSVGTNRVIINNNVRAIERAPRVTHEFERYPYEIERSIARKHWIDYEPRFDDNDPQAPKKFFETDLWIDLDDDDVDEPWTFVMALDDHPQIVKITPRWSKKTIIQSKDALYFNPIRRFYPYRFLPDPKGGFFPMGFGKLLDRAEGSADMLLAAIVDTAESAASNGGVAAGGGFGMPDKVELKDNRITVMPGDGVDLSRSLQLFPAKQVSPASVQVLDKVVTLADRLAGTLNLLENAPASMTATLARGLIDTGTQVQSAVHRRLVASLTQELRMFVQMADAYDMLPEGASVSDGGGVAVTADPQLATEMHRSALANFYLELPEKLPGVFNLQKIGARVLQIARVPNPDELIMPPQPAQQTPDEKAKSVLGLMKAQNDRMKTQNDAIKTKAAVAVQLTQALKNLVDAQGGVTDNRAALLQMAQLEMAVQSLMQDAQNAGNEPSGMGQQPADAGAQGMGSPPAGAGDAAITSGPEPSGAADAGPGSGLS